MRAESRKETMAKDSRQTAIEFYKALDQEFPHPRLKEHIANLEADAYDYWRNAGVAFDAISAHSITETGCYGRPGLSRLLYDKNRARLDEIRAEHASDIMFQV